MRYQAIESKIWHDEKFCKLSPLQQRLFLYLLTCPHSNFLGIFVLKPHYVLGDLQYKKEDDYFKDLDKLVALEFVCFCKNSNVLWVKNLLKYNHNYSWNEKHRKGAVRLLTELPENTLIRHFLLHYQTLNIPLSIPLPIEESVISIKNQNQYKESESPNASESTPTKTEIKFLIELWNKYAVGNIPKIKDITDDRLKKVKVRLSEKSISEWEDVFKMFNLSSFLKGDSGKWKATFDWIMENNKNYKKVLEGNYTDTINKTPQQQPFDYAASRNFDPIDREYEENVHKSNRENDNHLLPELRRIREEEAKRKNEN
jgi:hypothetical protein